MSMSLPGPIPSVIKAGQVGGGVWCGRYLGVGVGVHSRVGLIDSSISGCFPLHSIVVACILHD
jgi:hypothetical protein